ATAVDATFRQSPHAFVNRLRDAMAAGHPPTRAEVFGPRDVASRARDDVLALGVPCTAHWPDRDGRPVPRIASIDAPRLLQPGEPARVRVTADTRTATL